MCWVAHPKSSKRMSGNSDVLFTVARMCPLTLWSGPVPNELVSLEQMIHRLTPGYHSHLDPNGLVPFGERVGDKQPVWLLRRSIRVRANSNLTDSPHEASSWGSLCKGNRRLSRQICRSNGASPLGTFEKGRNSIQCMIRRTKISVRLYVIEGPDFSAPTPIGPPSADGRRVPQLLMQNSLDPCAAQSPFGRAKKPAK